MSTTTGGPCHVVDDEFRAAAARHMAYVIDVRHAPCVFGRKRIRVLFDTIKEVEDMSDYVSSLAADVLSEAAYRPDIAERVNRIIFLLESVNELWGAKAKIDVADEAVRDGRDVPARTCIELKAYEDAEAALVAAEAAVDRANAAVRASIELVERARISLRDKPRSQGASA